jgi:hypothetical protein
MVLDEAFKLSARDEVLQRQTFAKPEFIPISGIRSLAQTTSKRENLTAFHLPASQSF